MPSISCKPSTPFRQKLLAFIGLVFSVAWLSPDSLLVRLYVMGPFTQLFYKNMFFSAALVPVFFLLQGGCKNGCRALYITREYLLLQSVTFSITQYAFTISVVNTAAATTLALLSSSPLFSSFFSWLMLGEKLTTPTIIAILGGLVGVGIVFVGNLISQNRNDVEQNLTYYNTSSQRSDRFLSGGGEDSSSTSGNDTLGIVLGLVCAMTLGLYLTIQRYMSEKRPSASVLAPLMFVGPICCIVGLILGAYEIREPADLWVALIQGPIVGVVAFGILSVCPKYLLSSEVGLVQLLEMLLGPIWVWLAGYESPPLITIIGGLVLLFSLGMYFSYTLYHDSLRETPSESETESKTGSLAKPGEIDIQLQEKDSFSAVTADIYI